MGENLRMDLTSKPEGLAEGPQVDSEIMEWCGADAQRWAQAWCNSAKKVQARGDSLIDEGWMIGWFASAIEHSTDVRRRALPSPVPEKE